MNTTNVKTTDNIVTRGPFNPPYQFVIVESKKTDKTKNVVLYVVDDPALAYDVYEKLLKADPEYQTNYDLYLFDSFMKDALQFCKSYSEKFLGALTDLKTENLK